MNHKSDYESDHNQRLKSILTALFVTVLWSSSFIIIKNGLNDIDPVSFAGLRYFTAFLFFLPLILRKRYITEIRNLDRKSLTEILILGIVFYSLTQGIQFIGLSLLPAVTVSLMLNSTPLFVAAGSALFLKEIPGRMQITGIMLFGAGVLLYFIPADPGFTSVTGIFIMIAGVIFNALSSVLGRKINRGMNVSPLVVTSLSMGAGSILLVITGLVTGGMPELNFSSIGAVLWLALINTTIAFTLWNHTLRYLTATESSVINGTMLVQIAIAGYLFLNEKPNPLSYPGMILCAAGAVITQLKFKEKK